MRTASYPAVVGNLWMDFQLEKDVANATLLLKAGVAQQVVSERLGHSSPAFTMATYKRMLPGMQAEAAAAFADLVDVDSSTG